VYGNAQMQNVLLARLLNSARFALPVFAPPHRLFCSRPALPIVDHTGIFVDAENLGQFLSRGGARILVERASEFGNPIVRRAYGNWALPSVNTHQQSLVANGFQLIHTPHPISNKSAADMAMVVDVMEQIQRMQGLQYFMLATVLHLPFSLFSTLFSSSSSNSLPLPIRIRH